MSRYSGLWKAPGLIYDHPEAQDVPVVPSLLEARRMAYRWVAFNPDEQEWLQERRQARRAGLDILAWRTISTITDIALLAEAVRRWPGCAGAIYRVMHPFTGDSHLMDAVWHAFDKTPLTKQRAILTDAHPDPRGEWRENKTRNGIGLLEIGPDDDPYQCFGAANEFFRITVPVLRADLGVLADFNWRPERPFAIGQAEKVRNWRAWGTSS